MRSMRFPLIMLLVAATCAALKPYIETSHTQALANFGIVLCAGFSLFTALCVHRNRLRDMSRLQHRAVSSTNPPSKIRTVPMYTRNIAS